MQQKLVTIYHPDVPQSVQVPESAVRIHERSGWSTKQNPPKQKTKSEGPAPLVSKDGDK